MSKHTEGDWGVRTLEATRPTSAGDLFLGVAAGDRGICRVSALDTCDGEDRANARLIAAAPELLEACKKLVSAISGMYIEFVDREEIVREAEARGFAVIAKAEGK